jgi:hypothetical protein
VVPQLFVWTTVAMHEAIGVKLCSRDEPDKPHPLQDQLPPETGSGLSVTWDPEFAVTLAVDVRVPPTAVYAVIGVALHTAGGGGCEDPPPHADSAISAALAIR